MEVETGTQFGPLWGGRRPVPPKGRKCAYFTQGESIDREIFVPTELSAFCSNYEFWYGAYITWNVYF